MNDQESDQLQPGQVISPRSQTPDEATVPQAQPQYASTTVPTPPPLAPEQTDRTATTQQPQTNSENQPETQVSGPSVQNIPQSQWSYEAESDLSPHSDIPDQFTWSAAEFIAHDKSAGWYAAVVAGGVVAAVLCYLVTKDIFSAIIIFVAIGLFALYARFKPKQQQYGLDRQGVVVGNKSYDFQNYKSFSVADEGHTAAIVLMPLKRFLPALTVPVSPEIEDDVISFMSAILPMERHKADAVDSLMRRIRF